MSSPTAKPGHEPPRPHHRAMLSTLEHHQYQGPRHSQSTLSHPEFASWACNTSQALQGFEDRPGSSSFKSPDKKNHICFHQFTQDSFMSPPRPVSRVCRRSSDNVLVRCSVQDWAGCPRVGCASVHPGPPSRAPGPALWGPWVVTQPPGVTDGPPLLPGHTESDHLRPPILFPSHYCLTFPPSSCRCGLDVWDQCPEFDIYPSHVFPPPKSYS